MDGPKYPKWSLIHKIAHRGSMISPWERPNHQNKVWLIFTKNETHKGAWWDEIGAHHHYIIIRKCVWNPLWLRQRIRLKNRDKNWKQRSEAKEKKKKKSTIRRLYSPQTSFLFGYALKDTKPITILASTTHFGSIALHHWVGKQLQFKCVIIDEPPLGWW